MRVRPGLAGQALSPSIHFSLLPAAAVGSAGASGNGRQRRRLSAILAADVVGYSRLVGLDEAGTVARVRALFREVAQPEVAKAGGASSRLVGDGFLAEFPSAVGAVTCAAAIQAATEARAAAERRGPPHPAPASACISATCWSRARPVRRRRERRGAAGGAGGARRRRALGAGGRCGARARAAGARGSRRAGAEEHRAGRSGCSALATGRRARRAAAAGGAGAALPRGAAVPEHAAATPSRTTSPTAWWRTSPPRCRASAGSS